MVNSLLKQGHLLRLSCISHLLGLVLAAGVIWEIATNKFDDGFLCYSLLKGVCMRVR